MKILLKLFLFIFQKQNKNKKRTKKKKSAQDLNKILLYYNREIIL